MRKTTKTDKAARWECRGSVRGSCGKCHRTREAAQRHCDADQRACASLGGGAYSDRRPERIGRGY